MVEALNLGWWFVILPWVIFLLVGVGKRYIWTKTSLFFLVHSDHTASLLRGFSAWRRRIKLMLLLLAVLCVGLIVLRVAWGMQNLNMVQEGRSVIVALDISRSMLAQDVSPSRLELAKLKIYDILQALTPERVGLMVFANKASLLCPLTDDFGAIRGFVDGIDASAVASGKTSLASAISESMTIFARSQSKSKILLLVTDGEDFSPDLVGALRKAKEAGLAIFILGIGTLEGAPVPIVDALGAYVGHEKDASGAIILTKLDLARVSSLAQQFNFQCMPASNHDGDINQIVRYVNQFEKEKFDDLLRATKQERYALFAGVGLCALALEWIL